MNTDSTSPQVNADVPVGAVVVGIDGSDHATAAARWAAATAGLRGQPVALVHAASVPVWMDRSGADPHRVHEFLSAEAAEHLAAAEDVVRGVHEGLQVTSVIRTDDARAALLALAERAAMVVVGSRGRGPVGSLLLGSVGVALVRHAPSPVVVIRPGRHDQPHTGVTVGLDGRTPAPELLEFAFEQASLRGLPVRVVHAVPDHPVGLPAVATDVAPSSEEMEDHRRLTAELTSGWRETYPDVEVETRVGHGQAADVVVELAGSSDLLVVGAHQRHGGRLSGHSTSVSTAVVEHAHGPVAVIPAPTAG